MKILSAIALSAILCINVFAKTLTQENTEFRQKQTLTQKDSFSENNGLFFKLKVQGIALYSSSKQLSIAPVDATEPGFETLVYLEDTMGWGGGVSFGYQHFFIPQVGIRGYIDLVATNGFSHTQMTKKTLSSQSGVYINTTLNVDLMTNLISFYGYNFGPFMGFGVGYMFLPTSVDRIASIGGSFYNYTAPQGFTYQIQIGAILFKNKKGSQFEIGVQYIGVPNIAFDKIRVSVSNDNMPNSPKVWAKNLNDTKTSLSNIAFYASWGYKF